jgi:hypothetical protein
MLNSPTNKSHQKRETRMNIDAMRISFCNYYDNSLSYYTGTFTGLLSCTIFGVAGGAPLMTHNTTEANQIISYIIAGGALAGTVLGMGVDVWRRRQRHLTLNLIAPQLKKLGTFYNPPPDSPIMRKNRKLILEILQMTQTCDNAVTALSPEECEQFKEKITTLADAHQIKWEENSLNAYINYIEDTCAISGRPFKTSNNLITLYGYDSASNTLWASTYDIDYLIVAIAKSAIEAKDPTRNIPLTNNETLKITQGFSPQTQFFIRYARCRNYRTAANDQIRFFSKTPTPVLAESDDSHRIALRVV